MQSVNKDVDILIDYEFFSAEEVRVIRYKNDKNEYIIGVKDQGDLNIIWTKFINGNDGVQS